MAKPRYPSEKLDQYMLRLPDGMRERIKAAAEANNRSMNAEIVATLEEAYPAPPSPNLLVTLSEANRVLREIREVADVFENRGTSEQEFLAAKERFAYLKVRQREISDMLAEELALLPEPQQDKSIDAAAREICAMIIQHRSSYPDLPPTKISDVLDYIQLLLNRDEYQPGSTQYNEKSHARIVSIQTALTVNMEPSELAASFVESAD